MSRVIPSTSTNDSKKVNVKLNGSQKKQFDIVAELKPEWTVDDIYQFCQKHDFDNDKLQHSLDSTFEVDQKNDNNEENWYVAYNLRYIYILMCAYCIYTVLYY